MKSKYLQGKKLKGKEKKIANIRHFLPFWCVWECYRWKEKGVVERYSVRKLGWSEFSGVCQHLLPSLV